MNVPTTGNDCLGMHPPSLGPITSLCILSHDNGSVIVGYHNGLLAVRSWNAFGNVTPSLEVAAHRGSVTSLATFYQPPRPVTVLPEAAVSMPTTTRNSIGGEQEAQLESVPHILHQPSSTNTTVISASSDGDIKAWSMPQGEWMTTLSGHEGAVNTVAVENGPQGQRLVYSGGSDGTLRVWDLGAGTCLQSLRSHVGRVTCVFRPSLNSLTEEMEAALGDTVVFARGTKRVFTASDDTLVKLIDPAEKKILSIFKAEYPVAALQLIYPTLFVGSTDGTIRGFHAETAAQVMLLQGHKDGINALVCHSPLNAPGQQFLLSVSDDLSVKWWDQKSWQAIHTFTGHTKAIICATSDPKSSRILTGGFDKALRVWDGQTILESVLAQEQAAAEAAAEALKAKKKKKQLDDKSPKKRAGAKR